MPLIILCGLPSSGKSRRALELEEQLKSVAVTKISNVCLINENFGPDGNENCRNEVHSDATKEKELRSRLKSEVQRKISKDCVVILDASNYIKGYRYELYCISKSAKTTHCVVHCDITPEKAWQFNISRNAEDQYSKEMFDALVQRFEAPDERNRWDKPLFTLHSEDNLPAAAIHDALFQRAAPPPNQSTQCQPLSSTNFLYELDKTTKNTVQAIFHTQKTTLPGEAITVTGAKEKVMLSRKVPLIELSKLQRQFISYIKTHPVEDINTIPDLFVQYINKSI